MDVLPVSEWGVFPHSLPYVIAGPCSAETPDQVLSTAGELHRFGIEVFRAGIWKPRTHPGGFEGIGLPALDWIKAVKERHGMKVACEVACREHVEACLHAGVDMVWLGARTTANPFSVQEVADALRGVDIPVLVKNPVNPDINLWIGALERVYSCGIRRLAAVHRGVSTFNKLKYRNDPAWGMAIELRSRIPGMTIFCDPSHMGGDAAFVRELAQRALDLGFEGLMIESHINPSRALSDAAQQLVPGDLGELLSGEDRIRVRKGDTDDREYRDEMLRLRSEIDIIDEDLISLLERRMKISGEIGRLKKENNVAILQFPRWNSVLARMLETGRQIGLDEDFVRAVFTLIHSESVAVQDRVLEK